MRMSGMGRFLPVMPGLCERLLLGVKQSVSTCNFILGDSLQCAQAV